MGLLATLAGWFFLREHERRLESAYHEAAADRLLQQVNERLGKVELILRGVAGLFSAQNLVERREFENYVAGLRPIDALPEVVGIGFMRRVETARTGAVEALLSAATAPDPKRRRQRKRIVQGDVPSPAKPPPGCHFHTRCPYAIAECKVTAPPLIEVAEGHYVACLRRPVGGDPGPLTP